MTPCPVLSKTDTGPTTCRMPAEIHVLAVEDHGGRTARIKACGPHAHQLQILGELEGTRSSWTVTATHPLRPVCVIPVALWGDDCCRSGATSWETDR